MLHAYFSKAAAFEKTVSTTLGLRNMKYGMITGNDLRLVWRILVSVIICQLVGGAIGLGFGLHHSAFENLWLGGALATAPGFGLGLIWQYKSPKAQPGWIFMALFLGFLAITLTLFALTSIPRLQKSLALTADLSAISPAMIQEIEVYSDDYGSSRMNVPDVNSSASQVLFAEAMHDLSGYSPNHDKHTQEFFIRMRLASGDKHEFSIWLKPGVKDTAFMYMVERSEQDGRIHIKNLGSRKSVALYRWLKHHELIE